MKTFRTFPGNNSSLECYLIAGNACIRQASPHNCVAYKERNELMNMTVLKTTMIAAIASLGISSQAWAHHPSADMNPNYEIVDSQISDMHNEVIDAMMEDADLMSSTARGMDATSMTASRASGDGANASQAAARSSVQVDVAPGRGSQTAARGSGRR
jgi:hypothetical protein